MAFLMECLVQGAPDPERISYGDFACSLLPLANQFYINGPFLIFADICCEDEGGIILPHRFLSVQNFTLQHARRPSCEQVLLLKTSYLMSSFSFTVTIFQLIVFAKIK